MRGSNWAAACSCRSNWNKGPDLPCVHGVREGKGGCAPGTRIVCRPACSNVAPLLRAAATAILATAGCAAGDRPPHLRLVDDEVVKGDCVRQDDVLLHVHQVLHAGGPAGGQQGQGAQATGTCNGRQNSNARAGRREGTLAGRHDEGAEKRLGSKASLQPACCAGSPAVLACRPSSANPGLHY